MLIYKSAVVCYNFNSNVVSKYRDKEEIDMAYETIKYLQAITDKELVDYFYRCIVRITKAANGLQNLSEEKWSKEKERAEAEILKRMNRQ